MEADWDNGVFCDNFRGVWGVIGATQGIGENGMADKEMRLLEEGDEITTLWYLASYSGDDEFEPYTSATVTITDETTFEEAPLPDGSCWMVFEMWDAMGNYVYSDSVSFDCADGEIWTTVYED